MRPGVPPPGEAGMDGPRPDGPRMDRPPRGDGRSRLIALPFLPPAWQGGVGLVVVLLLLFVAVAAGAWPVVNHLTRRLQSLKQGMETFGSGQLHHRVEVVGRDEVAAVAASFNAAAGRIEALVRSHQSLLANASHELRSPLARMKMAVAMLPDAAPPMRERLKREIDTNIAELDALVEEVLLASRLDALRDLEQRERVDLLGLAAEEAARVDATLVPPPDGQPVAATGDERLLRRALRNLLENAKRYGGDEVTLDVQRAGDQVRLRVCDRGPGVPEAQRERIFEPFYRLPGHAETSGGVGLGLSLVKQIAERHHGSVRCEAREGGGSCFVIGLPAAR
jgi:signal transduction histidine kinase